MAENDAFTVVDSPFGPLGLLEPLAPDVALVHAAAADPAGNLVFSEPLLDGVWGAWAARRGVVATVERVVDDLEGLGHRVRIPGPPGPRRGRRRPTAPTRAAATRRDCPCAATARTSRTGARWPTPRRGASSTTTSRSGCSGPTTHEDYLARVGTEQLLWLEGRSDPMSWKADADANPVVEDPTFTTVGAGGVPRAPARSSGSSPTSDADAVLAGAGVANLSAWVAVGRARAAREPGAC